VLHKDWWGLKVGLFQTLSGTIKVAVCEMEAPEIVEIGHALCCRVICQGW
jgi:hypothetical protein